MNKVALILGLAALAPALGGCFSYTRQAPPTTTTVVQQPSTTTSSTTTTTTTPNP